MKNRRAVEFYFFKISYQQQMGLLLIKNIGSSFFFVFFFFVHSILSVLRIEVCEIIMNKKTMKSDFNRFLLHVVQPNLISGVLFVSHKHWAARCSGCRVPAPTCSALCSRCGLGIDSHFQLIPHPPNQREDLQKSFAKIHIYAGFTFAIIPFATT